MTSTSIVAFLSIAIGLALLVWSVWSNLADLRRPLSDPTKALGLARWLRTTILGLAAVAIGLGWLWNTWVVIGLALAPSVRPFERAMQWVDHAVAAHRSNHDDVRHQRRRQFQIRRP